jgi:hypothetical protein
VIRVLFFKDKVDEWWTTRKVPRSMRRQTALLLTCHENGTIVAAVWLQHQWLADEDL